MVMPRYAYIKKKSKTLHRETCTLIKMPHLLNKPLDAQQKLV